MTSNKTMALRELLTRDTMGFLMEAHNGMSAKVAEEAGFEGLWGSGLSISASMGVRDNNEMSWTQVLDLLEFMGDATTIPLLLDGDTGYGNFNNMRRLVQKLETARHRGRLHRGQALPEDEQLHRRQPAAGGHGRVLREDQGGQGRAARRQLQHRRAGGSVHRGLGPGRGPEAGRGVPARRRGRHPHPQQAVQAGRDPRVHGRMGQTAGRS